MDRDRFLADYSALVARSYELADAARWSLSRDAFGDSLFNSIHSCSSDLKVEAIVGSLRLADLALAVACREGIASAWEHFVLNYRPVLYSAARAIAGDGAIGRDLADSLYAELYGIEVKRGNRRSLFDYFHGRSSLATWLRAVLAQRHIDHIRETRRLDPLDEEASIPDPVSQDFADPHRDSYVQAVGAALDKALAALAPRERMRLGFYYRQGLKLREIARIMGESESAVSRHLERTRRNLKATVERALIKEHGLSQEQIRLCYDYAAEALPLDLARVLPEAG